MFKGETVSIGISITGEGKFRNYPDVFGQLSVHLATRFQHWIRLLNAGNVTQSM